MDWEDPAVKRERIRRNMDQRLARGIEEINQRMQRVERRWEAEEQGRRLEWEALAGRLMTAEEKHHHYNDGLLRKMAVMTNEQINILREFSEEMQHHFEENQAEMRANREATLKMLDRPAPG